VTEPTRDEVEVREWLAAVATARAARVGDTPGMVGDAIRRGRRRKVISATAAGASLAVVVGVSVWLVPGLVSGNDRVPATGPASTLSSTSPSPVSQSPTPVTTSTSPPSASTSPPAVGGSASSSTNTVFPACTTSGVQASVTASGSVASQPFAAVAVKNTGSAVCTLSGYPVVTFTSATGTGIPSVASHGSTYEVSDPGPTDVTIGPGDSAHFTLGTVTAAGGSVVAMPYALVSWGTGAPVQVRVDLAGSGAKDGDPIPVTITAFALGAKQAGLTP
jgi:hypothetical protein